MHLRSKRPLFVPAHVFDELDKLSKSTLMDIAWNFAAQLSESADDPGAVRAKIREEVKLIKQYRRGG